MKPHLYELYEKNLNTVAKTGSILFNADESDANKDLHVWNALRGGNRQALDYIFKHHASNLYAYGSRFTKDRDLVLDVIQDLFVELWNRRQNLCENCTIKYYLLKSLRRRIVKSLMGMKRFGAVSDELSVLEEKVDFSAEYFCTMREAEQQQKARLQKAIDGLTKRQRESVYLKFYQGLENKAIASIMGLTEASATTLVSQSVRALREAM